MLASDLHANGPAAHGRGGDERAGLEKSHRCAGLGCFGGDFVAVWAIRCEDLGNSLVRLRVQHERDQRTVADGSHERERTPEPKLPAVHLKASVVASQLAETTDPTNCSELEPSMKRLRVVCAMALAAREPSRSAFENIFALILFAVVKICRKYSDGLLCLIVRMLVGLVFGSGSGSCRM